MSPRSNIISFCDPISLCTSLHNSFDQVKGHIFIFLPVVLNAMNVTSSHNLSQTHRQIVSRSVIMKQKRLREWHYVRILRIYIFCCIVKPFYKCTNSLFSFFFFIQLIFATPFLMENPVGYMVRSFDLGRQFFFKWTVNWRFLPENIFLNRYFHISLLALHLIALIVFYATRWSK